MLLNIDKKILCISLQSANNNNNNYRIQNARNAICACIHTYIINTYTNILLQIGQTYSVWFREKPKKIPNDMQSCLINTVAFLYKIAISKVNLEKNNILVKNKIKPKSMLKTLTVMYKTDLQQNNLLYYC